MPHISKQTLDTQHLKQLVDQFSSMVGQLSPKTAHGFFAELLGPEEMIMLAKRLAAIAMFIEGNSSYRVWQLLKISPSTADRIRLNYEIGRYDHITQALTKDRKTYEEFWKTLEIILRAGLPPRGRGRWKSVLNKT